MNDRLSPPQNRAASSAETSVHFGIRWKLTVYLATLLALLGAIVTAFQIHSHKTLLVNELDRRLDLRRETWAERNQTLFDRLTEQVEQDIAAFHFSGVIAEVDRVVRRYPDIRAVAVVNAEGRVFTDSRFSVDAGGVPPLDYKPREPELQRVTVTGMDTETGRFLLLARPLQVSATPWGVIRAAVSLDQLDKEIETSKRRNAHQIRSMVIVTIGMSVGFISLSFLVSTVLADRFTRPIVDLTESVRRLSAGDFTAASRIRSRSRDEMGVLAADFIRMSRELKQTYDQLEQSNRTLEDRVAERTAALSQSLKQVEEANRKILEGLRYARVIQSSILPSPRDFKRLLPEGFILWKPRDIVGGDLYFLEPVENGFIVAVMDCTGHGVPGALMTMIAATGLRRIIVDEGVVSPDRIAARLNMHVKTTLQQDNEVVLSDDGLDAAFVRVDVAGRLLSFTGARLSLYVRQNGKIRVIKGDRQSIGYRKSDLSFPYTPHVLALENSTKVYLSTDGFIDQLGGPRNRRFGTRRFTALLSEIGDRPFPDQKEQLRQAFNTYRNGVEQMDDVTVLGFRVSFNRNSCRPT